MAQNERVVEAVRRAANRLPSAGGARLSELLTPQALSTIVAVLVVWAGSHAVGIGAAVDILLVTTGMAFLGWEALSAFQHLVEFARHCSGSTRSSDLDIAADHLAAAITIIGVDAALVLLTRGSVRAVQTRYKPTIRGDASLAAGSGSTNKFGDIVYSTAGSAADRSLVLYHEQVHSMLSPKLARFRELRADLGIAGYQRSSLLRYLEEALAESYAQLRVNGVKGLPEGIRFPVANGYVTLKAVATEALLLGAAYSITIGGIYYVVEYSPG